MIDAREREAKLVAHAGFRLPDFDGIVEGLTSEALEAEQLDATYYDTADLRLARSGITARHRTSGGLGVWTVKLPEGNEGPALVRRELNFDGPSGSVPAPVSDLVRAFLRSGPAVPVARLRTKRTGVSLRDAEGRRVADVVDDEVSVYDGRRVAARFREVEVELRGDGRGEDLLGAIVERLVAAGCRDEPAVPKVVRALGHRALEPPDVVVGELDDSATAADLVRTALAASVDRLLRHDPGVRVGDDPEDVHQARVATRRLRSDLRTFSSLIDADWSAPVVEELRWLGGALGAVRDADVLAERLRRQSSLLPERDAAGLGGIFRRLARQRDDARAAMLIALASARYVALLDVLVGATQSPPVIPEAADTKGVEVAPELVARRWRHIERAVDALDDDGPDDELHGVRILAKRCRYAAEAVAPIVGKPARRFGSAMADLQTVLGDHQDAVVAEGWLREAASGIPKAALVCGELIALQREEARHLRDEWPGAWKAASAKKLRSWM